MVTYLTEWSVINNTTKHKLKSSGSSFPTGALVFKYYGESHCVFLRYTQDGTEKHIS